MIPYGILLTDNGSIIADAIISKSENNVKEGKPLTLSLSFKINGNIREVFEQKNWERAYNKHDNGFRMSIEIDLKSGSKSILTLKFVRKAALFWTRNPKIPYRIWVSVIKDDTPFYPLTVEEAKSLLFDVKKVIELNGNGFNPGSNRLFANIKVRWGKHTYTEPTVIAGKSNVIEIIGIEQK
jgi:hypothetical protein